MHTDAYASGALVPAVACGFLRLSGPAGALKNRMLTQDIQPSRSGIGEVSGAAPQGTPTNIDACYSSGAPRCITDAYASGALVPAVACGFLRLSGPAGALKSEPKSFGTQMLSRHHRS